MKSIAMERKIPQHCGKPQAAEATSVLWAAILILASSFAANAQKPAFLPSRTHIENQNLRLEFDRDLRSRVIARFQNKDIPLGAFAATETVVANGKSWAQFPLISEKSERVREGIGAGQRLTLVGKAGHLTKTVVVTAYDDFPEMAFFDVQYSNNGRTNLAITKWINNGYTINAQDKAGVPAFWSYQSGSYEKRPNWVVPLKANFSQQNYLGMNASDYGGGTPVVDVWRRDVGIAVGHVELRPKLVSLPVSMPDATHARIAVEFEHRIALKPGESFHTLRTFVAVHPGDYFRTLVEYRRFMMAQGLRPAEPPTDGKDAIWCAWGYGRNVRPQQVYDTLPTVKKLGFKWVTLDDGWQNNVGDWALDPKKYPNGDADMRALVDRIHQEGFRAQLWWSPLSAVPDSELLKEHPDYALLNEDGSKRKISWWNSYYLCPADKGVVEYHKALVRKILLDWGFDGLKLDGQHMNGAPACYNPAHHHAKPEDSVEAMPDFFRAIYETAQSVKPGALVEFCPCGTAYSFFTMPYFNMSVASDPTSSFQVRSKAKTLKALMGDDLPFFGDHVELSDGGNDFASTLGVGGVVGTQFVLPSLASKRSKSDLTAAREAIFEKWLQLYREKMLSRGQYLGELYDIGFDLPETHVIRRDQTMYYAFYAKHWNGPVELRGLEDRKYTVFDYVNGKSFGTISGGKARLPVEFNDHLLLEVRPE
jgi:alpha-galactosidase